MDGKTRIFFGAIIVLTAGVLLVYFSGSPGMKDAVAHDKLCQKLKEMGSNEYTNCQNALDILVENLLETKELDLNKCRGNMTVVFCPVRVWYVVRYLVITSPLIIQRTDQINIRPRDVDVNMSRENVGWGVNYEHNQKTENQTDSILGNDPVRVKREVFYNANEKKDFKNKCSVATISTIALICL